VPAAQKDLPKNDLAGRREAEEQVKAMMFEFPDNQDSSPEQDERDFLVKEGPMFSNAQNNQIEPGSSAVQP
jgi:hypothetical protein